LSETRRYFTSLLNFTLKYTFRKVQENQEGPKLSGTHQLQFYIDDVTILHENIHTIKRNTEALLQASKNVGLQVNIEKTKCKFIYRHQSGKHKHYLRRAKKYFENVVKFKYFRTTVTNQI